MSVRPRRSITSPSTIHGTGLHSGAEVRVTFRPAPAGAGIRFRRADLPGARDVPARVEEVSGVDRATTLGTPPATIQTVEHALAAAAALALDDLLIEVDGGELPIMDGSAAPFLEALEKGGPTEHGGAAEAITIRRRFSLRAGDASYIVAPAAGLHLEVSVEWDHPLIGRQAARYDLTPENFRRELAAARTFGFVHEVAGLRQRGLARGGSTSRVVVLTEDDVLDTRLRWPDEFVRHKVLDLAGDLALVGARVNACIVSHRPSHAGNVALARTLRRKG